MGAPAVNTAIKKTFVPEFWRKNVEFVAPEALEPTRLEMIRARWKAVAPAGMDKQE